MLTICGYANSSVEKYADSNEFKFVSLTPPPTSKGDVNGDGEVDEMDAMLISRYSAGLIELTAKPKPNDNKVVELEEIPD